MNLHSECSGTVSMRAISKKRGLSVQNSTSGFYRVAPPVNLYLLGVINLLLLISNLLLKNTLHQSIIKTGTIKMLSFQVSLAKNGQN